MRIRGVAAVLALLALAAPAAHAAPPSQRGPQAHLLVVRGTRSATADVTFRTRIRAHTDLFVPGNPVTVTTKGTYAGVWLESLATPVLGTGMVVVPAYTGEDPIAWGSWDREDQSLPAGRYRVHLVTDGQSEVRLPVDGLTRDLVVRPARPSSDSGRLVRRQAVPGADAPADRTVVPVKFGAHTVVALASGGAGDVVSVWQSEICVHDVTPEQPCAVGGGQGGGSQSVSTGGMSGWGASFFYPGDLTPGVHDAEFTDVAVTVPKGYWAFALTVN
jgi:hypothetical protein